MHKQTYINNNLNYEMLRVWSEHFCVIFDKVKTYLHKMKDIYDDNQIQTINCSKSELKAHKIWALHRYIEDEFKKIHIDVEVPEYTQYGYKISNSFVYEFDKNKAIMFWSLFFKQVYRDKHGNLLFFKLK